MKTPRVIFAFAAFLAASLAMAGQASFDMTGLRYASGHDVFRILKQKFPAGFEAAEKDCKGLSPANRAFLGTSLPILGEPALKEPSPAFVSWYSKCVVKMIHEEITKETAADTGLDRFLGEETLAKISGTPFAGIRSSGANQTAWAVLPDAIQQAISKGLIHEMVGVEIVKNEDALGAWLGSLLKGNSDIKVSAALEKMIFALSVRDEFLSF